MDWLRLAFFVFMFQPPVYGMMTEGLPQVNRRL
jgi:hypothetical protein